ncbi:MAG TPA: hypothetical protein DCX89_09305 [Saprospirales bacterium]|nr:hypothetical protein [Saprospirales bacterium]HAY72073.1 hypothetical protein [Saprospirales bacterium]
MRALLLIMIFFALGSVAPISTQHNGDDANGIPAVFELGADDDALSELAPNYTGNLMSVCGNSMDKAYKHWMFLLIDMEDYSRKINFDLNGVKIWLNVYWNKNGKIDLISFYPKANSKNIPNAELKAFLLSFARQYQMEDLNSSIHFVHYGSASFPNHAELMIPD